MAQRLGKATNVTRSDIFVGTVQRRKSLWLMRRPSRTKLARCSRPLNMLGCLLYESRESCQTWT